MGYKSKYTGQEVENLLDKVNQGGGGSVGGAYALINHGTDDTTFTLTPNTFHVWDEVTNLTLTLGEEQSGVANEFLFQFESGETATTLTLPDNLIWANDDTPVIESNYTYQISILKGFAALMKFSKNVGLYFSIDGTKYQVEEGMTWADWVNSEYNTDGYFMSGLGSTASIYNSEGTKNVYMSNGYVFGGDLIIPQFNYATI